MNVRGEDKDKNKLKAFDPEPERTLHRKLKEAKAAKEVEEVARTTLEVDEASRATE